MITMQDLRTALKCDRWKLEKDTAFHLKRYNDTGTLRPPRVVIKAGTVVGVEKVYRRGRAALLRYTDRTGKVWWSWTHAGEYEPPRKYVRRQSSENPQSGGGGVIGSKADE
jgi:hypothetical protein